MTTGWTLDDILIDEGEEEISPGWGSEVEQEIRNRIRLSVYAYSYEQLSISLVSDAEFDRLAKLIRPKMKTGRRRLDHFFATKFSPDTGMWINAHPELAGIKAIYDRYYDR